MKKLILVVLVAFFATGLVFKTTNSYAVEGKVGVVMMYDWWKPGYLEFEREVAGKPFGKNLAHNLDGSFMLGPTFSIGIGSGWTFGTTLLFGVTRNEFENSSAALDFYLLRGLFNFPFFGRAYVDVSSQKIRRYDWDIDFSKEVHKYFDLLIGVRFNYGDGEGSSYSIGTFPFIDFKDEDFSAWYLGPKLGVGFHYEFIRGLTLGVGLSALIQFGQYNNERKMLSSWFVPYQYEVGYLGFGIDTNVRLAYLIAPAHLEVFVGGRYSLLAHVSAGDDGSVLDLTYKKGWITGELEHWGGIFFGAAYKF
jgi:hypothetical protein